jgi:hypothetical protein
MAAAPVMAQRVLAQPVDIEALPIRDCLGKVPRRPPPNAESGAPKAASAAYTRFPLLGFGLKLVSDA